MIKKVNPVRNLQKRSGQKSGSPTRAWLKSFSLAGQDISNGIKIPKFKDENAERAFWSKFDLADNFQAKDFSLASFPELKPTSQPISLRLPRHLLARAREQANGMGVSYQVLLKKYIADGVADAAKK